MNMRTRRAMGIDRHFATLTDPHQSAGPAYLAIWTAGMDCAQLSRRITAE